MPTTITAHQALIYTMITISAVDGNISDAELSRIGSIVRDLPVFTEFDTEQLIKESQACGKVLAGENGLQNVLDLIGNATPPPLRETAYALAVEVAASDLKVKAEEIRFLDLLAERLGLEKLVCAALERGARARFHTA